MRKVSALSKRASPHAKPVHKQVHTTQRRSHSTARKAHSLRRVKHTATGSNTSSLLSNVSTRSLSTALKTTLSKSSTSLSRSRLSAVASSPSFQRMIRSLSTLVTHNKRSIVPAVPHNIMNMTMSSPLTIQRRRNAQVADESASPVEEGPPKDSQYAITNFGLSPDLTQSLQHNFKITHLFPIQAQVMRPIQEGSDVLGKSKTGTGKTLAFLLPMIDQIVKRNFQRPNQYEVPILIMEPTRELANQVHRELTKLEPRLRTVVCYGGTSYDPQRAALRQGVHVCIATPGRLIDLLQSNAADLSTCKTVVLDEADEMLKVGFADAIEDIFQRAHPERQTILFSATVPPFIRGITAKYTKNVKFIDCASATEATPSLITHKACSLPLNQSDWPTFILSLFKMYSANGRAIIFSDTKAQASELEVLLNTAARNQNFSAALHGDISQNMRESILQKFRNGRLSVLLATDVAARGIDIPSVDLVVQLGIPREIESYVHRSGRTGRAGKRGTCVLCYRPNERESMGALSAGTGVRFSQVVTEDLKTDDVSQSIIDDVHRAATKSISFVKAQQSRLSSKQDDDEDISPNSTYGAASSIAQRIITQHQDDLEAIITAQIYDQLLHKAKVGVEGTSFSLLSSAPNHTTISFAPGTSAVSLARQLSQDLSLEITPFSLQQLTQTQQATLCDVSDDVVSLLRPKIEDGSINYVSIPRKLPGELFVGGGIGGRGGHGGGNRNGGNRGGNGGGGFRGGNNNGGGFRSNGGNSGGYRGNNGGNGGYGGGNGGGNSGYGGGNGGYRGNSGGRGGGFSDNNTRSRF